LDYFGARYLSAAQGRFTSPDPLLESGRIYDPQTWNRYTYVRNNPLRFIDPTGLDFYDADGNRIGATADHINYIVTDGNDVKMIKKGKTPIDVANVSSAIRLPNGDVIAAMGQAVTRSNNATLDDKNGGFHEEGGGYGLDGSGNQIAVAATSGPYCDPRIKPFAFVYMNNPANLADKDKIRTEQGMFHVHPKGQITWYTPPTNMASVPPGMENDKRFWVKHTADFEQFPSKGSGFDINNAKPGMINFVIGAGNKRVYIYNNTGTLTPDGIPWDRFSTIGAK
jgi:hypothetical protein